MTAYVVVQRADRRFPFCIMREDGHGAWVTVERWPAEAAASDRVGDLREESETLLSKPSNIARRPLHPPAP